MKQLTLDEDITLGCAFRYALGRMTYVVDSVANEIERHAETMERKTRLRIIREIQEALDEKKAGMDMDAKRWNECKYVLLRVETKVCDRTYKDGGAHTARVVKGVTCCPSCLHPMRDHK